MKASAQRLRSMLAAMAVGLLVAGSAVAQTSTTVDVRNFEVLTVEGNNLVVRDQKGTHEYTVPDDFRFTVDGKPMSVKDLKVGMKGTATITTTTTVKPVFVTEVKQGVVLDTAGTSVIVRGADGVRRYSQAEMDQRGAQVVKDGKVVRLVELQKGDQFSATIITRTEPVIMTEKEVDATLAQPKAAVAPTMVAAAPATTSPAPVSAAPTAAPAAPPPPASASTSWLTWILLLIVIAVIAFFLVRRKRA